MLGFRDAAPVHQETASRRAAAYPMSTQEKTEEINLEPFFFFPQ